jgi:hypothetical protein
MPGNEPIHPERDVVHARHGARSRMLLPTLGPTLPTSSNRQLGADATTGSDKGNTGFGHTAALAHDLSRLRKDAG